MTLPLIIYLDSQDYSRFADVLRGKSDSQTEEVFQELEKYKQLGDILFVSSMPIICELLQYDANYRDTTIKKAEAVERLCGPWTLPYPTRLFAKEILIAAREHGFEQIHTDIPIHSNDRFWYPSVPDIFDDIRKNANQHLEETIALLPSRTARRLAKKRAKRLDLLAVSREAAPSIAEKFGMTIDVVEKSLIEFLEGKISSPEASRRLFQHIANPTHFVSMYFEKIESNRDLPKWISEFGGKMQELLSDFRDNLRPYLNLDNNINHIDSIIARNVSTIGQRTLFSAVDDLQEFGIYQDRASKLIRSLSSSELLPSCSILSRVLLLYTRQILGLEGGAEAKIEHSFGGDLMHALYLPHVDLWRGDRRFSSLLKRAAPNFADRIIPTLRELPSRIKILRAAKASLSA